MASQMSSMRHLRMMVAIVGAVTVPAAVAVTPVRKQTSTLPRPVLPSQNAFIRKDNLRHTSTHEEKIPKKPWQILANKTEPYINGIIYQGQVGFNPRMQNWLSIWKSVHVIHNINGIMEKYMIIRIDAGKHLTKINIHSFKNSAKQE